MDEISLQIAPVPAPALEWPAPVPVRRPICRVCMVPHDDEIHAATLSIRGWFRGEVTKYFVDDQLPAAC